MFSKLYSVREFDRAKPERNPFCMLSDVVIIVYYCDEFCQEHIETIYAKCLRYFKRNKFVILWCLRNYYLV